MERSKNKYAPVHANLTRRELVIRADQLLSQMLNKTNMARLQNEWEDVMHRAMASGFAETLVTDQVDADTMLTIMRRVLDFRYIMSQLFSYVRSSHIEAMPADQGIADILGLFDDCEELGVYPKIEYEDEAKRVLTDELVALLQEAGKEVRVRGDGAIEVEANGWKMSFQQPHISKT